MQLHLSTIIIFVKNVDRQKSFYVDILKLQVVEEIPSEWVLLKAGDCNIALHKIGEQYLGGNENVFNPYNNTKIVFEIGGEIEIVRENLLKQNVLMRAIKTFENYNFLLCDGEDPEGMFFS